MKRPAAAFRFLAIWALVFGAAAQSWVSSPAPVAAAGPATDWPMYLHDSSLTAASTETILSTSDAPNLRPLWTFKTGGVIAGSATVVGGIAYVGSWDGNEYAFNATTGALIWKTFLGITTAPNCAPPSLGISSVAAVVGGTLYVGGGDSNWYALNAATGAVLWSVPTGDNSATGGHYNWSSPLIVGNSAYIGIASLGDCPLVQGQLLRVDLSTHLVVASVNFVPTGQVGGGVWTTPAFDAGTNTIYVTTGTLNQVTQTTSESMVALDATTLAIKDHWQIPRSTANADSDWGDSPLLYTDATSRAMVAGIDKNGFLYAFDRTNLAAGPVWADQIAIGGICPTCGDASVASMAFAGGLLFVGGGNTTIGGVGYPGAVRAINATTGAVVWAHGLADPVIPALAYDNGMVFAGSGPRLEVFDAASGSRIGSYSTGVVTYAPPSVSGGIVYMGSGNGTEYAFAPVTPTTPPADGNCPGGFVCQDIGSPSPAGSEVVSSGSWAISAGGAGVAGTADQFRFMSEAASGDLGLSARVTAETVIGAGTQTGLMVRQTNDAGSPFYALTYAGGNSLQVEYRKVFGGATSSFTVATGALPIYLQIQRIGDHFTASSSTNGVTYTFVPGTSATVTMPTSVMVGLASSSGANGSSGASTIDSLVLGAPGTVPSPPASASACPGGWSCADVGNPGVVGDQSLASGTWTIKGSGTPSGNNIYSDQFHFISQALAADGTLSARVVAQPNTAGGAQAGLEFRANATDPGAVFYGAFVTPTGGIQVVYRLSEGLRTTLITTTPGAAPAYLQITRFGTTYTTFTSTNGSTWNVLTGSSVTFGSGGAMVAGLTVDSGVSATAATDTLDSVSLTQSAAPPPSLCPTNWTCQDIGFPTPTTGSQYVVGPNWTVTAGGSDIWGTFDAFRLLSEPITGDGTISARIDSQANTSVWAKAGVMMRATNDPGSPYFAEFMTPGNGIAVQWRTAQGGTSSQVAVARTVPAWLEVARAGNAFTAYTSADGVTWTPVPGASVTLTMPATVLAGLGVTSHNGGQMGSSTFDTVTLTGGAPPPPPGSCPTNWTCSDIGNVGILGNQSLTSGTWTIQGGGGDIWDVADNFHYAYQTLATDGSVTARAITQTNTSVWAKAGVMLRASTDPGSPYYAAFITPANGVAVQWRSALAGLSTQIVTPGTLPLYLRVSRTGGNYSAFTSPDGANWTVVPGSTVSLGLTGSVLAGLAITSHNWGVLGTATLDSFQIAQLPSPWVDGDIGAPALAGSATSTNGVFTLNAGGSDIYGTADQLHLAYQTASGDAVLSARVASQTNTSSWAKTGVMLRSSTAAGSPYYAAFVTPGNGVAVQWRKTLGATTSQVKTTGSVPVYLRVTRTGNNFSAYTSPDGTTWTLVPGSGVTFTFAASELAGLAATSHNATKLGTVVFDSVTLASGAPPANDFSMTPTPATVPVAAGSSGTSSIATTLVSGTAETIVLSASGAPAGVTAGFAPTSVTAGAASTLTLTVASSVAPGTYPITVTGTAPSATHTTTVTLTVPAPPPLNDFSIGAGAPTVSVAQGGSGGTSVNTALVSGSAESIALSATGLPSGVTVGFVPASVTAGSSSTLTFNVGPAVTPGSYPITVTGVATSATHSTSVSLVVGAPGGLPSPWLDTDVGAPSPAGSASFASGVFTVKGSGVDIFGTNDQFNYVYQNTTGNGTMIARVTSQTNAGSTNDKAGVIWKASTAANSPYILIATSYTGLVKVQYNFTGSVTSTTYTYPNVWMKLVRSGSNFSAYLSSDNVTWTPVVTNQSLPTITTAATVGIYECSHKAGTLGTATFDNVSFTPGP